MENLIELMKQNLIFSIIITVSLYYLVPKAWKRLFRKIELGTEKELEDTIASVLENELEEAVEEAVKEFITIKEHGKCPGNNVADVLHAHREAQQKDFEKFTETIGREIGEIKTDISEVKDFGKEQEQRFYDHITKKESVT